MNCNQVWVFDGYCVKNNLKVTCKGLNFVFRLIVRSIQRDKVRYFIIKFYFKINTFLKEIR